MEQSNSRNVQALSWWISSLAISVVCCAILFVVFASYIVDLKSTYATTSLKVDMLEDREKEITLAIENLQRRTSVQQIQIMPSSGSATTTPSPAVPVGTIPAIENAIQNGGAPANGTTPGIALPVPTTPTPGK
jgi:hypothetical protein